MKFDFTLSKSADSAAGLHDLMLSQEARLERAIKEFIALGQSDEVIAEVVGMIDAGDISGAIDLIDQQMSVIKPAANQVFQTAAKFEAKSLIRSELKTIRPLLTAHIDLYAPEAAQIAQSLTTGLIRSISEGQAQVIQTTILNGWASGQTKAQTARLIRGVIGLSPYQVQEVESYRRQLQTQSASALTRHFRDRRFDPTVNRALAGDTILSDDQIDRMVEAFRKKRVAYRAKFIAQDQSTNLIDAAREVAVLQIAAKAGIHQEQIEGTWETNLDGKERINHGSLNGQVRRIGEPYIGINGIPLMRPHDPNAPASETCGCRCGRRWHFRFN